MDVRDTLHQSESDSYTGDELHRADDSYIADVSHLPVASQVGEDLLKPDTVCTDDVSRKSEASRVTDENYVSDNAPTAKGMSSAHAALKKYFGYDEFRPGQDSAVRSILSGRDVLGVMPTGAGKSICYQVPALVLSGTVIVISPLVSLMKDQVSALLEMGISAAYLNSSLSSSEQGRVLHRATHREFSLLYIAPERLSDERFLSFARSAEIPLIAIDEAHCVSQWGQDFRSAYLGIRDFIASLATRPVIGAFTATATKRVRADIRELLGLAEPKEITLSFDRPNLYFSVEQLTDKRKTPRVLAFVRMHENDCGVIYCKTRKDVETLHESLVDAGVSATRYHAGLGSEERNENQRAWIHDEARIMVATNAFGMGIDKPDVRFVIHYNLPMSMEDYYQEAGRAGRDGLPSVCKLFWSDRDIGTCRYFLERESENDRMTPEEAEVARAARRRRFEAMKGYCYTADCLRAYMLRYFGDDAEDCNACSNCTDEVEAVDVSADARAVMRCVQQLRGQFGKGMIVRVLRGTLRSTNLQEQSLSHLSSVGSMKRSEDEIKTIIELLAAGEYLQVEEGRYPTIGFGPRYREAASPEFSLFMKRATLKRGRSRPRVHAFAETGAHERMYGMHEVTTVTVGIRGNDFGTHGLHGHNSTEASGAGGAVQYDATVQSADTMPLSEQTRTHSEGHLTPEEKRARAQARRAERKAARDKRRFAEQFGAVDPAGEVDLILFERLRALRLRLSRESGIPPYIVFNDRTLTDMCVKKPQTDAEFLAVSGVGEQKLARYGELFMDEIRDYLYR